MTPQWTERPFLDLAVREESLLAFRRNLAALRALWLRGDMERLPEAVGDADQFLHALAFVRTADAPEQMSGGSDAKNLLQRARPGARQEGLAQLAQDTLRELDGVLSTLRAARDAIRDEMESLDRIDPAVLHGIDRIA